MEQVSVKTEEERRQIIESAAQMFADLAISVLDEASSSETNDCSISKKLLIK